MKIPIRFCDDCCQEKQTDWSDYFRVRLCMDCYNIRCECEPPQDDDLLRKIEEQAT